MQCAITHGVSAPFCAYSHALLSNRAGCHSLPAVRGRRSCIQDCYGFSANHQMQCSFHVLAAGPRLLTPMPRGFASVSGVPPIPYPRRYSSTKTSGGGKSL